MFKEIIISLNYLDEVLDSELLLETEKINSFLKDYNLQELVDKNPEIIPQKTKNKIQKIKLRYKTETTFRNEDIKLILNLLKTSKIFLEKTVSDNDLSFFYPVFVIFQNLDISPKYLKTLNLTVFSDLIDLIFKKLCKMKHEMSISKEAPYIEKKLFEEYKKNLEDKNIEKVYEFVASLERGNMPSLNAFINFLANTLLLNPEKYFNFLSSFNEPPIVSEYIHLIKNKTNKTYINYLSKLDNKWVLIEYLRQLFKSNLEIKIESDIKLVSLIFKSLNTIDSDFFINAILFFTKYEESGKPIGYALSKKQIIEKMVNQIEIDSTHSHLNFWTNLLNNMIKSKNKDLADLMAELIFNKWDIYLYNSLKEDEMFIEPIITDFFTIIIHYFRNLLINNRPIFYKLLSIELYKTVNYKSIWVPKAYNKRFIYLTNIYAMSESWKRFSLKPINHPEINHNLLFILNDERMFLDLYYDNNIPSRILQIGKNFRIFI